MALLILNVMGDTQVFGEGDERIELRSIDPSELGIKSIDLGGKKGGFNIDGIKNIIMKVYFREKHLKKTGILELSAKFEEELAESEIDFQNFNIREERYLHMLCNDPEERQSLIDFFVPKEEILVVQANGKRYFGKYAQKAEKQAFKEE